MGFFDVKKRFRFNIAGIGYRKDDIPRKWIDTNDGIDTVLEPEPDNKHDKNAIKVIAGGIHIGYVPKELTTKVRELMPYAYEIATFLERSTEKEDSVYGSVTIFYKK